MWPDILLLFILIILVGGTGVRISCFPYRFSRLRYIFYPLSPDSCPLLCLSCYHVNHALWLPILIRSALALSKIKKCVVNQTTSHSPARSLKWHNFLRHKFTPHSKIFSVLWTTVALSELLGRSFVDGFFPTTAKNTETNQNGIWRHLTWLAFLFLQRILTSSKTDETLTRLTQLTHVYMCHAISFISYDVSDWERFLISEEVMLSFCIPSMNIHFLTFLAYKILL